MVEDFEKRKPLLDALNAAAAAYNASAGDDGDRAEIKIVAPPKKDAE